MEALKKQIYAKAHELGAHIVRCTSADAWAQEPIQPPDFWPKNIWPWCERIIVLAIPLFPPMVDTTPSMLYQELYNTSNRVMDDMAYHLAGYLTSLGWRAMFFPRDCYADIQTLLGNPAAAFSHVLAGCYAGVGTIGDSHNLITREFGPRVRLVSVLTDAPIEPDKKIEGDLCIHCGKCLKACPAGCFSLREDGGLYGMNKDACTRYHLRLQSEKRFPCGLCANVCPVGEDLALYKTVPDVTPEGIRHVQAFGS